MADSTVELIKSKLDITDFLKGYINIQAAGRNFKANCPFHKEKTPSFMISPERQSWHCFGCGIGGDIFTFIMKYENIEFSEALKVLAEKAGVEMKRLNPGEYKFTGLLYDINKAAKDYFVSQLAQAPVPQKYLLQRSLKKETMEEFEVGWAPNEPEGLGLHLMNAGFSPDDIIRAGLSFKTERGLQMDRFRGRIMFPIHNHLGKVVGFTGRILPEFDNGQLGKYVNSPETPIFSKSKLLYGFFKSKEGIREQKSAFLVEGQMDFLMSWQAGIKNAIATSGTALTTDHLQAIRRIADRLILSFDNDEAGWNAGERAVDMAEGQDFDVRIVMLEGFKDPADAAAADPAGLLKTVASARPAPEVYFDHYLPPGGVNLSERGNLKNLRIILAKLKNMASSVERNFWMKTLASRTGIEEKILEEEAEKIEGGAIFDKPAEPQRESDKKIPRRELLSRQVLAAASSVGKLNEVEPGHLAPGYEGILDILSKGETKCADPDKDSVLESILFQRDKISEEEFSALKEQLYGEYLRDTRQRITEEIKRAERTGDADALEAALRDLNGLPY